MHEFNNKYNKPLIFQIHVPCILNNILESTCKYKGRTAPIGAYQCHTCCYCYSATMKILFKLQLKMIFSEKNKWLCKVIVSVYFILKIEQYVQIPIFINQWLSFVDYKPSPYHKIDFLSVLAYRKGILYL